MIGEGVTLSGAQRDWSTPQSSFDCTAWPTDPGQLSPKEKGHIRSCLSAALVIGDGLTRKLVSGEYQANARSLASAAWVIDQAFVALSWEP